MRTAALLIALLAMAGSVAAAPIRIVVDDGTGAPLADAVVWAVGKVPLAPAPRREASIEQMNKTFIPLVTPVQVGTAVSFPNHDTVRHHVYSFSEAKKFEIKLYVGTPVAPVVFDKAGVVVLGCNIHDSMIGYVVVVDSPYFAKSDSNGVAQIGDLPPGEYQFFAWHYAQAATPAAKPLTVGGEANVALQFAIPLRRLTPRPPPT